MKMGVGMRGPGEKQLEVDRRLVEKRIHDLRSRTGGDRAPQGTAGRGSRRDHMTVSLVGYTNAGKSTLMNALTEADVLVEDKLFATLDTRTRRWQLPSWGPVLLSDTVGFIRDLPHRLIASFKATLEESRQADLLLHVADASNPAVYDQIGAVYDVLRGDRHRGKGHAAGAEQDRPAAFGPDACRRILNRYPNAIPVSAKRRLGFDGSGLSRQRRAQPHVSRSGRRNGRRERPADGLSGGAWRSPLRNATTANASRSTADCPRSSWAGSTSRGRSCGNAAGMRLRSRRLLPNRPPRGLGSRGLGSNGLGNNRPMLQ